MENGEDCYSRQNGRWKVENESGNWMPILGIPRIAIRVTFTILQWFIICSGVARMTESPGYCMGTHSCALPKAVPGGSGASPRL